MTPVTTSHSYRGINPWPTLLRDDHYGLSNQSSHQQYQLFPAIPSFLHSKLTRRRSGVPLDEAAAVSGVHPWAGRKETRLIGVYTTKAEVHMSIAILAINICTIMLIIPGVSTSYSSKSDMTRDVLCACRVMYR